MLAHSVAETFKDFFDAQLSLARKRRREQASSATSSDDETGEDNDDSDETAEDGMHVVDVPEPAELSVTTNALTAEARQACRYAATRMSPPAAPSVLASLAHLLHVLHSYRRRDYTPCRHVTEDFKPDWFHRHAIVADFATTSAVAALIGSQPGLLGGYRGAWIRNLHAPESACASGCSCYCHQRRHEAVPSASGPADSPADTGPAPKVTCDDAASAAAVRAVLALQTRHDAAFERSELPVSFCPSCKGAAVPVALGFDPAGSGRTARAPINGT